MAEDGDPVVPETFSSLAGKGEPAKEMETEGPLGQQESQQSVVSGKPSGEGLERGGWELYQMPGECDWGVGWERCKTILRKILIW